MSNPSRKIFSLILCLCLCGCSTVGEIMNPYESEFSCANTGDSGTCSSLQTAYAVSVGEQPEHDDSRAGKNKKKDKSKETDQKHISLAEKYDISYRAATLAKLNKLVEAPVTPVVAPPTVMRILMYSYADDEDILNMNRFSYIMLDKPRWVIGDGAEVENVR